MHTHGRIVNGPGLARSLLWSVSPWMKEKGNGTDAEAFNR
jgi:hypothetical protein